METEKPFHSKEFMQQELDNLLNAPERPTWDEFKEQQRKKGEMDGTMDKVEQEAQDRFRKELDAVADKWVETAHKRKAAIQEQQATIGAQQATIAALEARLAAVEAKLATL